jgi:hypothetical protein
MCLACLTEINGAAFPQVDDGLFRIGSRPPTFLAAEFQDQLSWSS